MEETSNDVPIYLCRNCGHWDFKLISPRFLKPRYRKEKHRPRNKHMENKLKEAFSRAKKK